MKDNRLKQQLRKWFWKFFCPCHLHNIKATSKWISRSIPLCYEIRHIMLCSCDMPSVTANESSHQDLIQRDSALLVTQWTGVPISLFKSFFITQIPTLALGLSDTYSCECSLSVWFLAEWTNGPMIRLPGETASASLVALAVLLPSLCLRCLAAAWSWQTWALASD